MTTANDGTPLGTFASLRLWNYRLFFGGMLVSNTGLWLSRTASDWLVLVILTDRSATALGLAIALSFLPIPLLAPLGGAIADRWPKRRLLLFTQAASAVVAATLATLVLSGQVQLWHVYALTFAQGVLNALDNPARQAFVSELVPPDHLTNAVGLNSASFHAARLVGPGVGGLLIAAVGVGPAFVLNAVSFLAVIAALLAMRPGELRPAPRGRGRGGVREGLAYVRNRPDILLIMFLVFMLGTFGMNFAITNSLMATAVYGVGPEGYGLLGSLMAVGSLAGALVAARRRAPRIRTLVLALAGFTVFGTAAALSPTYWLFGVLLVPLGLCAITAMTTANARVQLTVDPQVRGRVMALYMAVFMGGTPLGSPVIGWVGDTLGPRWTLLIGALAIGASLTAAAAYAARTGVRVWPLRRAARPVVPPLDPDETTR